jgi:hypothetical protein
VSTLTVRESGDTLYDEIKSSETGPYLEVVIDHNEDASYAGITRCFDTPITEPGLDLTKPYTIEFTVRIDEDVTAGNFSEQDDRYQFGEVGHENHNVDTSQRWMVSCYGGTGSFVNDEDVGVWVFYDGQHDGASMDGDLNVESDVDVVSGGVYDFTIAVNPINQTYVGSVTDGTTTFTTDTLGWRCTSTEAGGHLVFSTRASDDSDVRAFSLDEVIMVPEPGMLVLLGIGLAMLAAIRHVRR